MANEQKILVSGAEANFLRAMLESAPKKFSAPQPNTADLNIDEVEKVTKNLQKKWIQGK